MSDAAPLTERATFRTWKRENIRYADTDRQGHVNNAVFSVFSESGRVAFLYDPAAPLAPPGCAFVVARLAIDFRAELYFPGTVDIGSVVRKIGRSSFVIAQGMFDEAGACVATCETVIVLMDEATRRATPIPDALRLRLEALR